MAAVPSIKGSVFGGVVEDVNKLLTTGAVSRREAEHWLQPEDLALLDQEVLVANWYDIRSYARMGEMLRDVEGHGSNEYLRDKGRETARRLLEGGLYAQLEYLQRVRVAELTDPRQRYEAFGRDLRLLTSLSASILNFSRWASKPDPDQELRYRIEVTEALGFPEVLCWRSDGFVNGMAAVHGDADLWAWERVRADLIVFRMIRAI